MMYENPSLLLTTATRTLYTTGTAIYYSIIRLACTVLWVTPLVVLVFYCTGTWYHTVHTTLSIHKKNGGR
jgi:hypothetical protein